MLAPSGGPAPLALAEQSVLFGHRPALRRGSARAYAALGRAGARANHGARRGRKSGRARIEGWRFNDLDVLADPAAADPSASTARAERVAALRAALEQLGADQRRVVELHYVHGFSYRRLAERLGGTAGSYRTRLRRLRVRLLILIHRVELRKEGR